MAFDEKLALRVRKLLRTEAGVVERRMFGGLAFLLKGHMSVGIHGSELIVRIAPANTEVALEQRGVRLFDITGRPMKGWLLVAGDALADDKELSSWVGRGITFARSLPPK